MTKKKGHQKFWESLYPHAVSDTPPKDEILENSLPLSDLDKALVQQEKQGY